MAKNMPPKTIMRLCVFCRVKTMHTHIKYTFKEWYECLTCGTKSKVNHEKTKNSNNRRRK